MKQRNIPRNSNIAREAVGVTIEYKPVFVLRQLRAGKAYNRVNFAYHRAEKHKKSHP
jgi:hypothetical protein